MQNLTLLRLLHILLKKCRQLHRFQHLHLKFLQYQRHQNQLQLSLCLAYQQRYKYL